MPLPRPFAPPVIYLCIYLFIYLLLYLVSCPHPGTVWLPQLDWEVREPDGERDSKGHRVLSTPPHPTPSWGVRAQPHPHQSSNSLGKEAQKWEAGPPTLSWGVGEVSGGPGVGQVPALLSLPLPLQGDRREEPPLLFPVDSSSRGTPGSRDRLSPGPRWGLPPASLPGRNAPSRPRLCNSPGQRGRGCQSPPDGRHYLPSRALACPGEDRSTHLRAYWAGPLGFKHTPLPHR